MKSILERSSARGHKHLGAMDAFYSFSYADYHNPNRLNFGLLHAVNDITITPQQTIEMLPQKNMDIVTLPLIGSLHHEDSLGNKEMIRWGQVQILHSGTGIKYSDFSDISTKIPINFLQIMFTPGELNVTPSFEVHNFMPYLKDNQISLIMAPDENAPVKITQSIRLSIAEMHHDRSLEYTMHASDNGVFVFLLGGHLKIGDFILNPKDSLSVSATTSFRMEALKNSMVLLIEVPL